MLSRAQACCRDVVQLTDFVLKFEFKFQSHSSPRAFSGIIYSLLFRLDLQKAGAALAAAEIAAVQAHRIHSPQVSCVELWTLTSAHMLARTSPVRYTLSCPGCPGMKRAVLFAADCA